MARLGFLGDTSIPCTDVDNPCTWWDEVWVRDECLAYLQTCKPTDPRVIAMKTGFVSGVAAEAGTITGNSVNAFTGNLFTGVDGDTNYGSVALVVAAGVVGLMLLQNLTRR